MPWAMRHPLETIRWLTSSVDPIARKLGTLDSQDPLRIGVRHDGEGASRCAFDPVGRRSTMTDARGGARRNGHRTRDLLVEIPDRRVSVAALRDDDEIRSDARDVSGILNLERLRPSSRVENAEACIER